MDFQYCGLPAVEDLCQAVLMLLLPSQPPAAEPMNPAGRLGAVEQGPVVIKYSFSIAQNSQPQPHEGPEYITWAVLTVSGVGRGRRGL